MNVGNDLDAFSREITDRFEATSTKEITDLCVKCAGFDLEICAEVLRDLRMSTPGNLRIVDSQKLIETARRLHVARGIEIEGEPKRVTQYGLFVPLELGKKIDRRTPEQKQRDEKTEKIKSWVDGLDEAEQKRLIDEAVKEWPEDLREFYRNRGIKSPLVREAMLRASHRLNPKEAA